MGCQQVLNDVAFLPSLRHYGFISTSRCKSTSNALLSIRETPLAPQVTRARIRAPPTVLAIHTHTTTHARARTHTRSRTRAHTHTHTHTHAHIYARARTHTHTHTHTDLIYTKCIRYASARPSAAATHDMKRPRPRRDFLTAPSQQR